MKSYLKVAVTIGVCPIRFWELTPLEFGILVDVHSEKMEHEQNNLITQAYLTAYWYRIKDMPKLKDLLHKKETNKQSPESMLEKIKAFNAAIGGNVQ